VNDFQDWGWSEEVEGILMDIENRQKRGDRPGKRWDTEEKCVEGSKEALVSDSRLTASANKAIHLSNSKRDEGIHFKHKWRDEDHGH
jgi:hypothetical protein